MLHLISPCTHVDARWVKQPRLSTSLDSRDSYKECFLEKGPDGINIVLG